VYAASIKKLPSVGILKPLLRLKGEVKIDHRTDFREVNPARIVGNKEAQRMIEIPVILIRTYPRNTFWPKLPAKISLRSYSLV
jgi:hypothetical protein